MIGPVHVPGMIEHLLQKRDGLGKTFRGMIGDGKIVPGDQRGVVVKAQLCRAGCDHLFEQRDRLGGTTCVTVCDPEVEH